MDYLKLFIRSVLIYLPTIILGTLFSALILSKGYIKFGELFLVGLMVTSLLCLPVLIFMVFGLKLVYKYRLGRKQLLSFLFLMNTVICIIPFGIFYTMKWTGWDLMPLSMLYNVGYGILVITAPYIISSYFFTYLVNILFDRKYPLHQKLKLETEDLLDDSMINEAS